MTFVRSQEEIVFNDGRKNLKRGFTKFAHKTENSFSSSDFGSLTKTCKFLMCSVAWGAGPCSDAVTDK